MTSTEAAENIRRWASASCLEALDQIEHDKPATRVSLTLRDKRDVFLLGNVIEATFRHAYRIEITVDEDWTEPDCECDYIDVDRVDASMCPIHGRSAQ